MLDLIEEFDLLFNWIKSDLIKLFLGVIIGSLYEVIRAEMLVWQALPLSLYLNMKHRKFLDLSSDRTDTESVSLR